MHLVRRTSCRHRGAIALNIFWLLAASHKCPTLPPRDTLARSPKHPKALGLNLYQLAALCFLLFGPARTRVVFSLAPINIIIGRSPPPGGKLQLPTAGKQLPTQ